MENLKEITWQELKDFINNIPEEFLQEKVPLNHADESQFAFLNEPGVIEHDIYRHKEDEDDCECLEILREIHKFDDEPFNEADYILVTKKGTPFLWIDHI